MFILMFVLKTGQMNPNFTKKKMHVLQLNYTNKKLNNILV